ncbi:MAG: N-acetyl-gamma-glutamyl-phosphate reductase [Bacteroidota bacterium]
MVHVGIIGASGYSGAELMRLLCTRDDIAIDHAIAGTSVGKRVDEVYPLFSGMLELVFEPFGADRLEGLDVVFIALPSGEAMSIVPQLIHCVGRIIDLGGDFRLPTAEMYEKFYLHKHTAPALLGEAVYGLPELNKEQIATAHLVANPGCYPTSAILPLLPVLRAGIVSPKGIVINSLSGVSGAGRSASVEMSFVEVNENIRAYKIGKHQHTPEIQTVLEQATGQAIGLSFVPHLVPLTRGIYSTIHADLNSEYAEQEIADAYREFYADAPFVRLKTTIPQIKDVAFTNFCDIGFTIERRTKQLIINSTIDNLVKGAAGQAIQNMNIMLGLSEETGFLPRGRSLPDRLPGRTEDTASAEAGETKERSGQTGMRKEMQHVS